MATIQGLLQTIKDATEDLKALVEELENDRDNAIALYEAEQERNVDHYNDEKVWVTPLTLNDTSTPTMARTYTV